MQPDKSAEPNWTHEVRPKGEVQDAPRQQSAHLSGRESPVNFAQCPICSM